MALTDKLSAIGVAIRQKTGKSDLLTLDQMPTEIASIVTGGGELPEEALVLTGECQYKFAYSSWQWFFDMYKNQITTHDITNAENMFRMCMTTEIPFTINVTNCKDFSYMFYNTRVLSVCPKIRGTIDWSNSVTFDYGLNNMSALTDMEDMFTPEMMEGFSNFVITSTYSAPKLGSLFNNCTSLRKVPSWFYKLRLNETSPYFPYYNVYTDLFNYCGALDEVRDLQVWSCQGEQSSNMLDRTFRYCGRLKAMTFETNEDGSPVTAKWKSQLLDLSKNVGYTNSTSHHISDSKQVRDDTTYQSLKNDPDWWTMKSEYSRYNHDSAVETINSLPDTSATGTNTIKFLGTQGSLTDGGAINTLTEEEIAVAAAKGWTVTYA